MNPILLPRSAIADRVDDSQTASCANPISESEIREEETRICHSTIFCSNQRVSSFLSFLVTAVLNHNLPEIDGAQTITGLRVGPVLQWEATLLRDHLHTYYACEGKNDPVVVEISSGDYVPTFYRREVQRAAVKTSLQRSSFEARPARNLKNRLRYSVLACLTWVRSVMSRPLRPRWLPGSRIHRCQGQGITS